METFVQVFGFVAAVSIGVIALTLYFAALDYFKRGTKSFDVVRGNGFIRNGKPINVHLNAGKSLQGVRFVGFTSSAGKDDLPYQLSGMVVLENAKGGRILVRADTVRMIEEM